MRSLILGLILALVAGIIILFERGPPDVTSAEGQKVHVIDGDSLRIGAEEIRLAGIDAPEYKQNCTEPDGTSWACGKEAREVMEGLVAKGGVACETRARDRYGRRLAICTGTAGNLAQEMVRAGFAEGAGDERFDEFTIDMAKARAAKRGIWRGGHQRPGEWREANPRGQQAAKNPA